MEREIISKADLAEMAVNDDDTDGFIIVGAKDGKYCCISSTTNIDTDDISRILEDAKQDMADIMRSWEEAAKKRSTRG